MKRGPSKDLPSVKRAKGTFRPHRDAGLVEVIEPEALPAQPDWLTTEGELIWQDDVGRVANGRLVTERDSMLFGTYCNLAGACAKAWKANDVPPAAHLTELRRLAELFGLAGAKSRVVKAAAALDGGKSTNPFSRNGRRE